MISFSDYQYDYHYGSHQDYSYLHCAHSHDYHENTITMSKLMSIVMLVMTLVERKVRLPGNMGGK